MKWDNFAVQIEDPQPAVFQLGYVNLATAEIKGFEAEFAVDVQRVLAARRLARVQQRRNLGTNLVLGD